MSRRAELGHRGVEGGLLDVGQDEPQAPVGEVRRHAQPDAAGPARDDRDLAALEFHALCLVDRRGRTLGDVSTR